MRSAALLLIMSSGLLAQEGGIDGTVINKVSGQPLSGVQLHFLTGDFAGQAGITGAYGAVSDQAGHYSVSGMKPGFYAVLPERAGYVPAVKPGGIPVDMITIKPGQQLSGQKFEMNPRALIAGRVVDENGDPVQNSQVRLEAVESGASAETTPFVRTNSATDDRGEFRLICGPGKFYLQAQPAMGPERIPEIRTDGSAAANYSGTYYPSSPNKNSAAVVEAVAGQDITNLEIRLARNTTSGAGGTAVSITGIVNGLPEGRQATVLVRSPGNNGFLPRATTMPGGRFNIQGLQPGVYGLLAITSSSKPMQSQLLEVHLPSADQSNVQLTLGPAPELTGTLEFSAAVPAQKRMVRLEATGFIPASIDMTPGEVDKNGAFSIGNASPGKYRIRVEPLPENAYVKSVTMDGAAAEDEVLDLSRGVRGTRVKITVDPAGAQISGKLLDKDGQPLVGPLIMIFLAADAKHLQEDNAARSADGNYSIKAIRPGNYKIFAIDVFKVASVLENSGSAETLKPFFEVAEAIEIKGGDRVNRDLKVIDRVPGKESGDGK